LYENTLIKARQRGLPWKPGENVHVGKDHTIHASKEGKVVFTRDPWHETRKKIWVHVIEQETPNRTVI
jgi:ribosomal protein L27